MNLYAFDPFLYDDDTLAALAILQLHAEELECPTFEDEQMSPQEFGATFRAHRMLWSAFAHLAGL